MKVSKFRIYSVKEILEFEINRKNGESGYEHLDAAAENQEGIRICDKCGKFFTEGVCIEGGVSYFCDKDCMNQSGITDEEFDAMYDDGEGDTYWTEWEEEIPEFFDVYDFTDPEQGVKVSHEPLTMALAISMAETLDARGRTILLHTNFGG